MSDEELDQGHDNSRQTVLEDPDENTLRIMLSTDNHLGYNERDPVRGGDSFAAFEEVLYLAKRFNCDMVLLAGDLFHENKPSRHTMYRAMEIIRRYCMGDNPVRIQILSDQSKNFPTGVVNYQDPNYSVDLPIFSIHGNHDDPVRDGGDGQTALAALDLLSVSNLVNYMGKQDKVDQVEISPVLLEKGSTRVALFGLGSMRDERLNRMWNGRKVRFLRPTEEEDDDENEESTGFFNIFALHQNRDLGRGSKNCVQESMIPEWMDLVVWGHEHECLIDFFESVVGTFRITQPGSSVATSLVAGEAARKKVGILDVLGKQFRLHTVPLTQVRAFVTTDIALREHRDELDPDDPRIDEQVTAALEEEVRVLALHAKDRRNEVLEEALAAGSDGGTDKSPLKNKLNKPHEVLIRLRVEHTDFTTLNNQRFGAKFVGEVANPEDILLFHRKKDPKASTGKRASKKAAGVPIPPEELIQTDMDDLVNTQLEDDKLKLELLSEKTLGEALDEYIDKSVLSSMDDAADFMLNKRQKALVSKKKESNDETKNQSQDPDGDIQDTSAHDTSGTRKKKRKASDLDDSLGDDANAAGKENSRMLSEEEDSDDDAPPASTDPEAVADMEEDDPPPKSRARSRGPRAANGDSKRKAVRRQKVVELESDESESEISEKPKGRAQKGRSQRASRGTRVNYSMADSDEDAFDEEEEQPKRKSKKVTKSSTASKTKQRKATTTTKTARRAPRTTAKKRQFDDDSDDDFVAGTADLDDDWGTSNTRSQV